MIFALLGRFFRHCLNASERPPAGIRLDQYDPSYMTDQEVSDFLHGRVGKINWDRVKLRRRLGVSEDPWASEVAQEKLA